MSLPTAAIRFFHGAHARRAPQSHLFTVLEPVVLSCHVFNVLNQSGEPQLRCIDRAKNGGRNNLIWHTVNRTRGLNPLQNLLQRRLLDHVDRKKLKPTD